MDTRFEVRIAITLPIGPRIVSPQCKCPDSRKWKYPIPGTVLVLQVDMLWAETVTMSTRGRDRPEILCRVSLRRLVRGRREEVS